MLSHHSNPSLEKFRHDGNRVESHPSHVILSFAKNLLHVTPISPEYITNKFYFFQRFWQSSFCLQFLAMFAMTGFLKGVPAFFGELGYN